MVAFITWKAQCKRCKKPYRTDGTIPYVYLNKFRALPVTCPKCQEALWRFIRTWK